MNALKSSKADSGAVTDLQARVTNVTKSLSPLATAVSAPKQWRRITTTDIEDVMVHNAHSDVTEEGTNILFTSVPGTRGCGKTADGKLLTEAEKALIGNTGGTSMGIFIGGQWTQIRFRLTLSGMTSCYSMLGHERYHSHDSTDSSDHTPRFESVKGATHIYLGDTGLYQWDKNIDSVSKGSNFGDTYGTDMFSGKHMKCDGNTGLWKQEIPGGDCSQVPKGQCVGGAKAGDKAYYIGPRSSTFTMRRKFKVYGDGVKQYVEDAGPSLGVSCTYTGGASQTKWIFDNIEILE